MTHHWLCGNLFALLVRPDFTCCHIRNPYTMLCSCAHAQGLLAC